MWKKNVVQVGGFQIKNAMTPGKQGLFLKFLLIGTTVDGRNPAPPGMVKTL